MELEWENGKILTQMEEDNNNIFLINSARKRSSTFNWHIIREDEQYYAHNIATCTCRHSSNFLLLSASRDNAVALMPTPDSANHKRINFFQAQDSESHCNDDDQSGNALALLPGRKRTKRKRAAQVHKESEKKRRDKINKRLRALQDLIPNCTKMDKASVLDEVIEYLKSLQHQLQIMSVFAGLCVPPTQMMFPTYYPPAGTDIALRLGMGARCNDLQLFSLPFVGYGTRLQMPMDAQSMMLLRRSAQ